MFDNYEAKAQQKYVNYSTFLFTFVAYQLRQEDREHIFLFHLN